MVVGDAGAGSLATTEQAARFKVDVWREPVEEWLGDRKTTASAKFSSTCSTLSHASKAILPKYESPRFLRSSALASTGHAKGTSAKMITGASSFLKKTVTTVTKRGGAP